MLVLQQLRSFSYAPAIHREFRSTDGFANTWSFGSFFARVSSITSVQKFYVVIPCKPNLLFFFFGHYSYKSILKIEKKNIHWKNYVQFLL